MSGAPSAFNVDTGLSVDPRELTVCVVVLRLRPGDVEPSAIAPVFS